MNRLKYWQDATGKWRWTCYSENGHIVGSSSQGFTRKSSARKNAKRLYLALGFAL